MATITTKKSQLLAESICRESISVVQQTMFTITNGRDRTRLALYLCGVEYADLVLATIGRETANMSIVPVFRSAFEAWRDLCVLTADGSHIFRMERDFLTSKRQVVRAQIKYAQSDPATTHRVKELNSQLDEVKTRLAQSELVGLKQEDVLSKTFNDKGVLAMLWPLLCNLSHNNLNALAERHLPDRDSVEKKLFIFSPLDAQLRSLILTQQIMFLVTGLESLRPLVNSSCIDAFDQSIEKVNRMWLAVMEIETDAFVNPS